MPHRISGAGRLAAWVRRGDQRSCPGSGGKDGWRILPVMQLTTKRAARQLWRLEERAMRKGIKEPAGTPELEPVPQTATIRPGLSAANAGGQ
jgi:hypothetical protein